MAGLLIGTTAAKKVFIGTTAVNKVYLGSNQIWQDVIPVAYDAVGAGSTTGVATSISWSHTAHAGAYVLAAFCVSTFGATLSGVTYGGSSMSLIGSQNMGAQNDKLFIYGLANAPGGAQTVSATSSASTFMNGCSVSYLHVSSVGSVSGVSGSSASPSQSAVRPVSGMVFQAFGAYNAFITASSGGTQRYNAIAGSGYVALAIQDSSANSPTFSATLSAATPWAGVAVALNP